MAGYVLLHLHSPSFSTHPCSQGLEGTLSHFYTLRVLGSVSGPAWSTVKWSWEQETLVQWTVLPHKEPPKTFKSSSAALLVPSLMSRAQAINRKPSITRPSKRSRHTAPFSEPWECLHSCPQRLHHGVEGNIFLARDRTPFGQAPVTKALWTSSQLQQQRTRNQKSSHLARHTDSSRGLLCRGRAQAFPWGGFH